MHHLTSSSSSSCQALIASLTCALRPQLNTHCVSKGTYVSEHNLILWHSFAIIFGIYCIKGHQVQWTKKKKNQIKTGRCYIFYLICTANMVMFSKTWVRHYIIGKHVGENEKKECGLWRCSSRQHSFFS